jgi:hypothetical protein
LRHNRNENTNNPQHKEEETGPYFDQAPYRMREQGPPRMEESADLQTDSLNHRSQVVDDLPTPRLLYSFFKL